MSDGRVSRLITDYCSLIPRALLPPCLAAATQTAVSQRLYDCPQCGAPVKFLSSIAVFAVCEHCRSMVVARDAKVETMGVMAELPGCGNGKWPCPGVPKPTENVQ